LFEVLAQEVDKSIKEREQLLEIREFPGCDEMIFADSERLYQAFRNIITNAIKYTPDKGAIIVDGRKLAGFVEVTIEDTGIGIDPEDHQIIFQKFGRLGSVALHSSSKTKFKGGGPGLGLPITKGILEAHGGTIWVESERYDEEELPGAKFHILLPLQTEPPDDKLAILFKPME
jgi:signal transduction histidine kinase